MQPRLAFTKHLRMEQSTLDLFALETEKLLAAGEKLIRRHSDLGPDSPLKNGIIAELNAKISRARQKHDEGMKYRRAMEDALHERDCHLGTNERGVVPLLKTILATLEKENVDLERWV